MSNFDMDFSPQLVSVKRSHVSLVMAVDSSWSMGCTTHEGVVEATKTRLEVASEGACRVIDSLNNGDHTAVIAFGDEIQSISDGLTEISASTKCSLKRNIAALTPSGSTRLYDTIILGCKLILKIAATFKQLGQTVRQEAGTFWFVILTDGEDNRSKSSLANVKAVLTLVSRVLESGTMKAVFIGVKLTDNARRNLEELSRAGGTMASFVDARNLETVAGAFERIAVQIETAHECVSYTPRNSHPTYPSPWVGSIQKGMHVRYIGPSHDATLVSNGDVGVAKARDMAGNYLVDFPNIDNWPCRIGEIALDTVAEKVRPGALVSVKPTVTSPMFGWGQYKRGMHGLVVKVEHSGVVHVQCGFVPSQEALAGLWKSQLKELEIFDDGNFQGEHRGSWKGKFQLGQAVRVSLSLHAPTFLRREIGYVRGYKQEIDSYICDFPSADGWQGCSEDLEVDVVATMIRPGKKVRVREGITPSRGWGSISPRSVGVVSSIRYNGSRVIVKFPENSSWMGTLADLDTLDRPPSQGQKLVVPGETACAVADEQQALHTDSRQDSTLLCSDKQRNCNSCAISYRAGAHLFPDGAIVQIIDCSLDLNGELARVISKDGNSYNVKLLSGNQGLKKVKEENLITPYQKYKDGTFVSLCNIKKAPELNGYIAKIVGFDSSRGRYAVICINRMFLLLPNNFEVLPDPEEID